MTDWKTTPADGLEAAIAEFKAALPGWWFSVCECQVSCDASCAPTSESSHLALIPRDERFNNGFHADLPQPSTLAAALRTVMDAAVEAIEHQAVRDRLRKELRAAEDAVIRSRNAAGSSNYNGRCRTEEALAEVKRLRAALAGGGLA